MSVIIASTANSRASEKLFADTGLGLGLTGALLGCCLLLGSGDCNALLAMRTIAALLAALGDLAGTLAAVPPATLLLTRLGKVVKSGLHCLSAANRSAGVT